DVHAGRAGDVADGGGHSRSPFWSVIHAVVAVTGIGQLMQTVAHVSTGFDYGFVATTSAGSAPTLG
ncbi:hypothetical protein, partial [Micromonospora sp. CPCC 206061]|uniref:hypothetical protein n=1 Tax=Micromonospora sp. CPCC 206061 TaxID=3122410 RepID=UPI002FF108DE